MVGKHRHSHERQPELLAQQDLTTAPRKWEGAWAQEALGAPSVEIVVEEGSEEEGTW